MIPELGHFALIVALLVAIAQGTLPLWGAYRRDPALMALAKPAARAQFVLVAIAFGCLMWSFATGDFSVDLVAQNSNSQLPMRYRIAATWGSHEGSLLLWVLMLTGWSLVVTLRSRNLPAALLARVLAVMGLISVGFLLFLLFTSNPFLRLVPAAAEGRDLNPLLQDPGMVIHPPMLYMGYVGFSVAFAFSIAALLAGKLDATWARWSRPWTTAAWSFLTIGIALGSWWSYYVLGWGGWWFWDPVENASFMPWLAGTALLHSLAVSEKRGTFKSWTVLLAIVAFSLSLLGTFLVRSGVLTSVHAFATDPARGVFILVFLALVVGGSLTLYAARAAAVGGGASFAPVSRESLLLANNILLVVACASVLLGTLYPLVIDALGVGKISVGPPYFDAVFLAVTAPLAFLIAVGPIASWRRAELPDLWTRLRWALAVALVTAGVLPFVMGNWTPLAFVGLFLAVWIAGGTVSLIVQRFRPAPQQGFAAKLRANPAAWYGMVLAHFGVAVFITGVTMVKGYGIEQNATMDKNQTVQVGGFDFTFRGVVPVNGPNYAGVAGIIDVSRNGVALPTLHPEKRIYNAGGQAMTDAAIDKGFLGDRYVSLGEPVSDKGVEGAWAVRLYIKPFVEWIWFGCFLMALGGFTAMTDRRYRLVVKQTIAAAVGAPA
ncbi:MAG TPA: heme lyase CcmF/NrfE family subunit [Casimicrobiaceae bacterium]|nr:heme lyase CcmF/NrfE family subunit [Casimicrobiaceae bacterium]